MKKRDLIYWLLNQQPAVFCQRIAAGIGVAILLLMTGDALAQAPAPLPAPETKMTIPSGYTIHSSIDVGGRIISNSGSDAMYDTLVNLQSGPRVLDETFELRILPGQKSTFLDNLKIFGTGFGGDPYNLLKLTASKGKAYEFSGLFRRDRQYFDYDLLGNPNIVGGSSIPIGSSAAPTGQLAWPQVLQSPVMFNTVRRMTDTTLTIFPISKLTYRLGYSQNVFEGPSLSPGVSSPYFALSIGSNEALLQEYQRNSTDDYMGAIDWKPIQGTKLTFEEQIDHYKGDSYFTLAPSGFIVQEADGTLAAPGGYDSQTPYGISSCNTKSMGSGYTGPTDYTILSPAQTPGGLPVINPACAVATYYMRSQPTRILYPTESFLFQSSSIKHLSMNGDFRYTNANMNLPDYYENFLGLSGAVRSITYTGNATAKREVVAGDYGVIWQVSEKFSVAEQLNYSNVHQPGTANITKGQTLVTPTNPNETITYSGPLTPGPSASVEGSPNGAPLPDYFGQKFLTNNLTGSWDVSPRTVLSLTYRYQTHLIAEGIPNDKPLAVGATNNGTVSIDTNGGIFNAAVRPTNNWNLNGTVEMLWSDNVFTPLGARQSQHYRVHTLYRPKPWASFTAAYNDLERHNNTNNNQAAVAADLVPYEGPLDHVDHSRVASLGAVVTPNARYGFDFNYAYTSIYTATNICYDNGATPTLPGTASLNSAGTANVCPNYYARGSTTQLAAWYAKDFMNAPTQYVSAALTFAPVKSVHTNLGYRVSSVNGTQFFNDARSVNGSLDSIYQTPFVNFAWTMRPGLTWKADYNYYGYGEGGPSGPEFCSTSTALNSVVSPCTSFPYPTGLTEPTSGLTAPRTFHANALTLSVRYEF